MKLTHTETQTPSHTQSRLTRARTHARATKTGPALSEVEAGGLRARPTPLPSLPREISSAPSSRSIQSGTEHGTTVTYSCSVIAASVRVHTSGPRHKYCQCYTQWTDKQLHSDPSCSWQAIRVQHVQAVSKPTLVDQSETRQVSDLGPPPLELTGRPSWGRKQHVHGHIYRRFPEITGKDNLTVFSYSGRVKSPEWRRQLRRADLRQF